MTTAHKDLDFDTPEGRARLVARALCSPTSRKYHDDIPEDEFPSEDMLASALMVLLPLFGSIRVPEAEDGELGGVLLTVTPIQHISLAIYPPSVNGATTVAVYSPPGMPTPEVVSRLTAGLSIIDTLASDDGSGSVH